MAVNHVDHYACYSELDAEVDHAHADDDGDGPGLLGVEGLAPGEEAGCCEKEEEDHYGQAEFGFFPVVG